MSDRPNFDTNNKDLRARPDGPGSHERSPKTVSAASGFDPSRGPDEECSPGAAEWVAANLNPIQARVLTALCALPTHQSAYANEIPAASGTLLSLLDFARGKRDIMPPLMLVRRDYSTEERCWHWQASRFGRDVAKALGESK
jgi:hypothetical protein